MTEFLEVHERLFHLFILSRDLEVFRHEHPERRADGRFELRVDLEPGEYILLADFLPAGGTAQMVQRTIVTPKYSGRLFASPPELRPANDSVRYAGGVDVRLRTEPLPMRETTLRFALADSATGRPVADLEPYLGAEGHLLVVHDSLVHAIHAHPLARTAAERAQAIGEVAFDVLFPEPGDYKLWLQFQRKGQVVTVPFVIRVAPR